MMLLNYNFMMDRSKQKFNHKVGEDMENMNYEKAITRLEEIVAQLENNAIPLEDSIVLFQEGVELSHYCNDKLKNIREKVTQIYENGKLTEFQSEE